MDRAEADVLSLVVEFADACPADRDASGLLDGPPAETAVVELGARLGISYRSAAGLVREALELRDRLPWLWGLVQQGRLQAWKARQVARVTASLSDASAEFVDVQAAVSGCRNRLPDLRKLVIIAINRCDPEIAEGLEEAARDDRGVRFEYSSSTDSAATARLEATLDLLDALDLDATVSQLASEMGRLGDDSPLGVRRAHALGELANPQRTLDLFGDPVTPALDATAHGLEGEPADPVDAASGKRGTRRSPFERRRVRMPWEGEWNSQVGHLYLHLDAADLRALHADGLLGHHAPGAGGVDLESLGAASLRLVREWLGRVTRVSVRPVLDMAASAPVDRHDPPEAMRAGHAPRRPLCLPRVRRQRPGMRSGPHRSVRPDRSRGPPGQTHPGNVACLCRRHHRMKTHHGWHYRRARDGTYLWFDPHGLTYTTVSTPMHPARPDAA